MRGMCRCERRDADGRDEAGNGILHRCSPEKPRADEVARPLLVIEVWPNSLIECLGLKIRCAASLAVAVATTSHLKPEAGLLPPVNQLRSARWVRQGGRNAFNRDWSCCCGWAFAPNHGADPIGAGERRSHRSSRGRNGFRDGGALLVHMARLARLLPALALLVRGRRPRCKALSAPINERTHPERAGPIEPGAFSFEGEDRSSQRVCGAAKLTGGRVTLSW
jgi:hypothetical protein